MKKDKDLSEEEIPESEDGSGTEGSSGARGVAFTDWLSADSEETELPALSKETVFENRISIKSQGYDVAALNKKQDLRQQIGADFSNDVGYDPGGLGLEKHPELPEFGGTVEPENIVLPDSELVSNTADPKLQQKLRARIAAKFGMGTGDLSREALENEYKNKLKARAEQPRYKPSTPRPRPM